MKNLKNLGQALSKAEQKTINGGKRLFQCGSDEECGTYSECSSTLNTKVICYQNACILVAC